VRRKVDQLTVSSVPGSEARMFTMSSIRRYTLAMQEGVAGSITESITVRRTVNAESPTGVLLLIAAKYLTS